SGSAAFRTVRSLRTTASESGAKCGVLGARERGVLVEDPVGMRPCLEQEAEVLGEVAVAQSRYTCLTRTEQLARPALGESLLCDPEAVAGGDHRVEAAAAVLAEAPAGEQQTVRCGDAPTDAAAQLMELREAEPIGVVDDHHGRRGHVDTDLDHRRGDEHV